MRLFEFYFYCYTIAARKTCFTIRKKQEEYNKERENQKSTRIGFILFCEISSLSIIIIFYLFYFVFELILQKKNIIDLQHSI